MDYEGLAHEFFTKHFWPGSLVGCHDCSNNIVTRMRGLGFQNAKTRRMFDTAVEKHVVYETDDAIIEGDPIIIDVTILQYALRNVLNTAERTAADSAREIEVIKRRYGLTAAGPNFGGMGSLRLALEENIRHQILAKPFFVGPLSQHPLKDYFVSAAALIQGNSG